MSQAWTRNFMFLTLFCVWPLPLLGLDGSLVPAARFLQLGVSLLVLILIEGSGGIVGMITGLMWGHAIGYGILLWIVASLLARFVFSRVDDVVRPRVLFVVMAFLISWGIFGRPYDTQFHHSHAHASLVELYQ